jgi:hypothetical protein
MFAAGGAEMRFGVGEALATTPQSAREVSV